MRTIHGRFVSNANDHWADSLWKLSQSSIGLILVLLSAREGQADFK
jgi:hypothetical protein